MPEGVWQVLQGRTSAPLPANTIIGTPGCAAGAAAGAPPPPPPPAGAGALASGVMKAQSGPGASAAIAVSGNKALASNHANFFMGSLRVASGWKTRLVSDYCDCDTAASASAYSTAAMGQFAPRLDKAHRREARSRANGGECGMTAIGAVGDSVGSGIGLLDRRRIIAGPSFNRWLVSPA